MTEFKAKKYLVCEHLRRMARNVLNGVRYPNRWCIASDENGSVTCCAFGKVLLEAGFQPPTNYKVYRNFLALHRFLILPTMTPETRARLIQACDLVEDANRDVDEYDPFHLARALLRVEVLITQIPEP